MKKIVLLSLTAIGLVFGAQAGEKAEKDLCERIEIYPKINMKAGECEFKDGKYILYYDLDEKGEKYMEKLYFDTIEERNRFITKVGLLKDSGFGGITNQYINMYGSEAKKKSIKNPLMTHQAEKVALIK